jgi:hypothetical protein
VLAQDQVRFTARVVTLAFEGSITAAAGVGEELA